MAVCTTAPATGGDLACSAGKCGTEALWTSARSPSRREQRACGHHGPRGWIGPDPREPPFLVGWITNGPGMRPVGSTGSQPASTYREHGICSAVDGGFYPP